MSDYLLHQESRSLTKKMLSYLPPEVITQILSRLPVESAVKCTAVCKSWYALIKDPSFISAHLQQAASLQDDLLLVCFIDDNMRYVYHLYRDNDAFEQYKQLLLPFKRGSRDSMIVGSCNGLICLSHVEKDAWNIILWNPSIRKHFVLPGLDLARASKRYLFHTLGFGFDSVSNDYKVLLVLPCDGDAKDNDSAWLFSLNTRSWKRLTEVSPIHSFYGVGNVVFVKGALHYGLFSHTVLAFDVSTEKFSAINIPEALVPFVPRLCLIRFEESIALGFWGNSNDDQLELWAMKEYGVDRSWTKVSLFGTEVIQVFVVGKKRKLFLSVRRGRELACDLATLDLNCNQQEHHKPQQQIKCLGGPISLRHIFFGSYVESLVLLDKGEEDIVAAAV